MATKFFFFFFKRMGKQRPRIVSRGRFSKAYTPKETVNYEQWVKACYIEQTDGYMFEDNPRGLEVDIFAYYKMPKGTSKKKRDDMLAGRINPTKKPDADNIAKIVCDSLNGIAYSDDARIIRLNVIKSYAEQESVEVVICDL